MEGVLSRLEAVTTRLESYERGLKSSSGAATPASSASTVPIPPVPAAQAPAAPKPVIISVDPPKTITVADWDSLIVNEVGALSVAGDKLPAQFQSTTKLFASAAQMMVDVVKQSRSCRKPTMEELSGMVAPMGGAMQDIEAVIRGPRTAATNHHRALLECVQSFAWVTLDPAAGAPPPKAILADSQAGADVFINRVIMEYRQTAPEHKEWTTALKAFMAKLEKIASSQFPQGLTWTGAAAPAATTSGAPAAAASDAQTNDSAVSDQPEAAAAAPEASAAEAATTEGASAQPAGEAHAHSAEGSSLDPAAGAAADAEQHDATNGVEASADDTAPAATAAPPKGPPPPPPPPPAGMLLEKLSDSAAPGAASGAAGGARGELMAALNKGSGVTTGLKKVTADMKTKNQANRSGVVKAGPAPAGKPVPAAKGPTCKELKQNRWLIENWVACEEPVVLAEAEVQRNHAVYISNCSQCVVQVKGKVNTVMLDGCSKVGLVFSSVLATVEAVNCQNCQIQCEQSCPTLSIDKTDGAKVFLSEEAAAATEVVTSKCSALVVTVLPKDAEVDPVEHPVPEQFVSKLVDGKLVTSPVIHL